jgi:hypothetical protein
VRVEDFDVTEDRIPTLARVAQYAEPPATSGPRPGDQIPTRCIAFADREDQIPTQAG